MQSAVSTSKSSPEFSVGAIESPSTRTRANAPRDQVPLVATRSVDWQSLTLTGERHEIDLRLIGPDAAAAAQSLCNDLEDAEFSIPGLIIADIGLCGPPRQSTDGSLEISLEAPTIAK